jgi:hypothetical protein
MTINKLEKDYNEFYKVASTIFQERATTFIKFLADIDTNSNIRLTINSIKRYDIENLYFSVKIEYIFDYPVVNMPIDVSSHNDIKKIEIEYKDDFLHSDGNRLLDDFQKIVSAWTDIKTSENRDLALKKLDMLVRSYKMNEDFQ